MKWTRKAGIGVLIFIALALLFSVGVNFWIKYQLPKIINNKSETYAITYKSIDIEILAGNVVATGVVVVPRASMNSKIKAGIYATADRVEIKNFTVFSIIFTDRISARSLTLDKPKVILYKSNDKVLRNPESLKHSVVKPFEKIIAVSDVYLNNGDLKIVHVQDNKPIVSVANINLKIDGIKVTDAILKGKIPFSYDHYSISCDSLYSNASPFYDIQTKKIITTEKTLKIDNFALVPKFTRREFVKKTSKEKDLFEIKVGEIALRNLDWGYKPNDQTKKEVLFVNANAAILNQCSADIYRNKLPPDDLSKKFLYNKLLRELDFDLKIDTLKVRNSLLAYEEEKDFNKGSGKLVFNKFNLTAINICSGFQKKRLPDLKIHVSCKFMDVSPLKVDWKLNVMDKSDGFNIKGSIMNFDSKKIAAFTKPYINATTEGTLNEVYFNFTGNDAKAHGQFAVKYDNFKVTFYQKNDREKKNKFLTAVGNLFVKNDTKGKVKGTDVELDRIPEKSFYNFLWRSIAEGLKDIFI